MDKEYPVEVIRLDRIPDRMRIGRGTRWKWLREIVFSEMIAEADASGTSVRRITLFNKRDKNVAQAICNEKHRVPSKLLGADAPYTIMTRSELVSEHSEEYYLYVQITRKTDEDS